MATIKFFAVEQETEKAVKLLVRTSDYDLEAMKVIKSISYWIPKSVVKINGNTADIADWFFNKNIAVDTYASFMKSLSNS